MYIIKNNNYDLIQRIIKKNKLNLSYSDFYNSIIEVFPFKSKKIINNNKKNNNSYDNNIINYIKNNNFDIYLKLVNNNHSYIIDLKDIENKNDARNENIIKDNNNGSLLKSNIVK